MCDLKQKINDNFNGKILNINDLLIFCTENECSDLYIKIGECPRIFRYGILYEVPTYELTNRLWQEWAKYAITHENNAKYVREKMLDFSYVIPLEDVEYRYRVSVGFSLSKNTASFRIISKRPPSFKSINFPTYIENILKQISQKRNGITLFCGVTGSGKTTTFASCINDFSKPGEAFENSVIISLEDPIEYVYDLGSSVYIIQKELGTDFKTFNLGVKQALREHPNFINVGETRDKETINTLVEAARTGHAVFTSFHSSDVADTISRLYNYLINENSEIMYDLISNINMIICQKLIPDSNGFKLNIQYMVFTEQIVLYLNEMIQKGKNIPSEINKLFKNKELLNYKLVKNWD